MVRFSAGEVGERWLGHIVRNEVLVQGMMGRLQEAGVRVMERAEVERVRVVGDEGEAVEVGVRGQGKLRARLVVGADGAGSKVRGLCGIGMQGKDFGEEAIVGVVRTAGGHKETAWQCFAETGTVAMLPLADGGCGLVWSCGKELAEELMGLDEQGFGARVEMVFGRRLGAVTGCEGRRRFALKGHHAERYVGARVALVGDAAHGVHPMAGLGANLGFVDAAALAEVVGRAWREGRDVGGRRVLRGYERWRRGDNAVVVGVLEGLHGMFGSERGGVQAVRGAGMRAVDGMGRVKRVLAKVATGRWGDLPRVCRRGVCRGEGKGV